MMQIVVDENENIRIDDEDDFKRFQVAVSGEISYEVLEAALGTIGYLDSAGAAWIHEKELRKLGRDEGAWQEKLTGMIAFAATHGWTNPDTGDIRAHIVGSVIG